jgi:hypothetical protein
MATPGLERHQIEAVKWFSLVHSYSTEEFGKAAEIVTGMGVGFCFATVISPKGRHDERLRVPGACGSARLSMIGRG